MTREEIKQWLPIFQAVADGKVVQTLRQDGFWVDSDYCGIVTGLGPSRYRIKPYEDYDYKIIRININNQCKQQHRNMLDKGFDDKDFARDLMLIVSELSEALEADRKGKDTHKLPLPIEKSILCRIGDSDFDKSTWKDYFESYIKDTIQDEIADALLRIMDLCGRYDIDIDTHVAIKSYYNSLRKPKHGKKY
ncbi:MAG: hypothetical protein PUD22_02570 [Erysipelotrichaceae bacterium]|nr:hypothetical protein [Erysipelotrichaceae bacterium]